MSTKPETMNPLKVISHKDCYIKATVDGNTFVFAEAESFTATLNITTGDVQPMGEFLISGIATGYSIAIAVSNFYIRDDPMNKPLFDALAKGVLPVFIFEGVGDRTAFDGQEIRQTYRNCVPSDSITLFSITPGEFVKQEWNFRCNATPEQVKMFS